MCIRAWPPACVPGRGRSGPGRRKNAPVATATHAASRAASPNRIVSMWAQAIRQYGLLQQRTRLQLPDRIMHIDAVLRPSQHVGKNSLDVFKLQLKELAPPLLDDFLSVSLPVLTGLSPAQFSDECIRTFLFSTQIAKYASRWSTWSETLASCSLALTKARMALARCTFDALSNSRSATV